MYKIAVLQQRGHLKGSCTENQKKTFKGHDFYALNWAGDLNDIKADWIITKPIMFTEGRQLLYELINRKGKEYDYYIFIDDDIKFTIKDGHKIIKYLTEWHPLSAAFQRIWMKRKNKPAWDSIYCEYTEDPICVCGHDEDCCIFHQSVIKTMFPLMHHGCGRLFRIIQWAVYNTFPEKYIRFPDIIIKNMESRTRGKGHDGEGSIYANEKHILADWRKVFKEPPLDRVSQKKIIQYMNANTEIEPSKNIKLFKGKKVTEFINVKHYLWKNRNWLYEKFKNDYIAKP